MASTLPIKNPDRFPFVCWEIDATLFGRWVARGVDTASTNEPVPDTATMLGWATAAVAAGIKHVWVKPSANPADDLKLPGFEAWELQDEPDSWNNIIGFPDASKLDVPSTISVQQQAIAALRAISPNTPIYQNFNGWSMTSMGGWARDNAAYHPIVTSDYQRWMLGLDWVSADAYPLAQQSNPSAMTVQADIQDRLASWGVAGQTRFAYVECGMWSEGQKAGRIVSPDEFRFQFWLEIIKGAKGIGFFQQPISNPSQPDPMPAALDAEIRANIALVRKVERYILTGTRVFTQTGNAYSARWTIADGSTFGVTLTNDPTTATAGHPYPLLLINLPVATPPAGEVAAAASAPRSVVIDGVIYVPKQ